MTDFPLVNRTKSAVFLKYTWRMGVAGGPAYPDMHDNVGHSHNDNCGCSRLTRPCTWSYMDPEHPGFRPSDRFRDELGSTMVPWNLQNRDDSHFIAIGRVSIGHKLKTVISQSTRPTRDDTDE